MQKNNLLPLLLCFISLISEAQISFQPLNGPAGTDGITLLGSDAYGQVFIKNHDGLFTTSDNADTWIKCDTGLNTVQIAQINSLIFFPSGKVSVFVDNQYFTYGYGAHNWSEDQALDGLGSVMFDHLGNFWKRIGNSLYRSTDGGQTYTLVLQNIYTGFTTTHVATYDQNNNLYSQNFSEHASLYVFDGAGAILHSKTQANPINFVGYNDYSGTAFYSDIAKNYRSTDGGATWNAITLGTYGYITRLYSFSTTELWAVTSTGLYHSTDDGQTWIKIQDADGNAQICSGQNGAAFIKDDCTALSFSKSTDGGQNWTAVSAGNTAPNVRAVFTATNDVVFAKTCTAYQRSDDAGQTWAIATAIGNTNLSNLEVLPDGAVFSLVPATHQLLSSNDGGNFWQEVSTPAGVNWWNSSQARLASDPFGNVYLLVSQNSVYKSTDKGVTWESIGFQYVASTGNDAPYWIMSNGDYFTPWGSDGLIHFVASTGVKTPEILVLNNGGGVARTIRYALNSKTDLLFVDGLTDAGKSFVGSYAGNASITPFVSFPGANAGPMAISANGTLFVVSNDTLYASPNNGADWVFEGRLPFPYTGAQSLTCMTIGADQHLYLGYYGHVVFRSAQAIQAKYNLVEGFVWLDKNANCVHDPTESAVANVPVTALGAVNYYGLANASGAYRLFIPAGTGDYTIEAQAQNALAEPSCPIQISVGNSDDTLTANAALIPISLCPYLRINASTSTLRRCNTANYSIQYANEGTAVAPDAHIEITLDTFFQFQSASVQPTAQNGQVLRFDLGDFQPGTTGNIQVQIGVSCSAPMNQLHCLKAQIFPGGTCPGMEDLSVETVCRQNVSSFDPNEKHAYAAGKENPGVVAPNEPIEYQINFQNTGADTAFTVVVEDRISNLLDLNSFVPLTSSHPYDVEIKPERRLIFRFEHILLPDSNTNEPASHGFVKFRINQMPDLALGTAISNSAQIFFDINDPVSTNTSHLLVAFPVKVLEPSPEYSVQVFPNPFDDAVTFQVNGAEQGGNYQLLVTDALGRSIVNQYFTGNSLRLNRNGMAGGVYFFVICTENGQKVACGMLLGK